ncbi:MAG: DNA mismatch repair protein MutS [Bacteroidetes bacterium]|nr:DNA mismatch repair protein MutS [Bacteroidota bacterium]
MRQYHQIKEKYPDTVLLFRLGDFYETFEEDAGITSRVCGITLTKRANGAEGDTPLAGFPYHQLDNYLPKLVRAGYRVAVCEQMEDPKLARGIVRRDVIEVVTPGVAMSEKLLDASSNNYLAALYVERGMAGIAFCDISTGEFQTAQMPEAEVDETLETIGPAEIIISRAQKDLVGRRRISSEPRITKLEEWIFDRDYAEGRLREHFGTQSLKGFGLEDEHLAIVAAGAAMHYLMETQRARLAHIRRVTRYAYGDYIALDPATKRNLEIIYSSRDGGRAGSLVAVIDRTSTPMGGRLLKRWLVHPLKQLAAIERRLSAVEALHAAPSIAAELEKELRQMSDLERMVARVATGRATPRDLGAIRDTIARLPRAIQLIERASSEALAGLARSLNPLEELVEHLGRALPDEPPATLADGGAVRSGFSEELDELRELRASGKSFLESMQERERARTGISSLKVGYNNVFGYYIEITNANRDRTPADYIRRQTLANAERYITPELKEYEEKILHAEEKLATLEREIFAELMAFAAERSEAILRNAQMLATIDCLVGFARLAQERDYRRPTIEESARLEIVGGRHPVVETLLPPGERYVPNGTDLDAATRQIAIITGPNMAGKSSYLRQVGLIVLLAQIGSFVPAERATIGLVDKIFTRVGAHDNIAAGESTFLVEMHEAANILNNATPASLVLLDEVGRGTSTFDGISIAWSMTEYIHEVLGARTLFATHYHELNALADRFDRIHNYKVEVREHDDQVIFLRKVAPGTADHSYGIQVAQMAGLPEEVTARAKEIMAQLESASEGNPIGGTEEGLAEAAARGRIARDRTRSLRRSHPEERTPQISLFEIAADPMLEQLRTHIEAIDLDNLTPMQALSELERLRNMAAR